jgi:hypothetical protein
MAEAKVYRLFIGVYSLFKSEQLSANIKMTSHKTVIRLVITYLLRTGICGRFQFFDIAVLVEQDSLHHW